MEYIIINLVTISFFTYIVYVVANKILAIHMHVKFPILCACCALLINLILPRMFVGIAGLTGTLGIVIVFAIISSYGIAYYYDDTIAKAAIRSTSTTNFVEVPEMLQTKKEETIELINNLKEPEFVPSQEIERQPLEQKDQIVAEDLCACVLEAESVILPADLNNFVLINDVEEVVETVENSKVITESVDKKYFYPIKYEGKDMKSIVDSEIPLNNVVKIDKGAKVFKIKMNFKNKTNIINIPLMLETIHKHLDVPIATELLNSNKESIDPQVVIEDLYPSSNDLDILMDFAFLQKEQRNFIQALKFFRQALILYPNSEVGPFLVMEVGTILKNLGSYDEALEVFTKGRLLPGITNNSMLEQEFINNIAYLRIVKNILIQNSLEFMPFNRIPKNIFNEIDSQFCEWRNQS